MLAHLRPKNDWSKQVPVLVLTNLGSDNRIVMRDITSDIYAEYLVKSNWPMRELVEKVLSTLAKPE